MRVARFGLAAATVSLFASAPSWAATHRVEIKDVAFGTESVSARIGDTVEWVNKDIVAHTATARDGSFEVDLPPGKAGRVTLRQAGAISYYCRYHPNMQAAIAVAK